MSDWSRKAREAAASSPLPKMLLIGLLVFVFLAPLGMIHGLVRERSERRGEAEREIVSQSGGEQTVAGPYLVVPFIERTKDARGDTVESVRSAYFLPRTLAVTGTVTPERRKRGIYEVTVYGAQLEITGSFGPADFAPWRVSSSDILWSDAALMMEVSGMHGLKDTVSLVWEGKPVALEAARGELDTSGGALRAALTGAGQRGEAAFRLTLGLQGGRALSFLPLGGETRVHLDSAWPSPGFGGAFLPTERAVTAGGFEADWYVLSLARSHPQSWRAGEIDTGNLAGAAFGVVFMIPVDSYLKSERSVKYGVLFVLLPFVGFFLFELWTRTRVHLVQYLLVGVAECLFYLVLLSLSEHIGFDRAYLVSSAATVALVSVYAGAVLGGWRRGLAVPPLLSAGYGFLYAALQSEDYALLIGALGLFAILAVVMVLTRRVDWYRVGRAKPDVESSASPAP